MASSIRLLITSCRTATRGVFKIVLDEANGVDIKRERWHYTYEIPPSGILRVKSFEPFYGPHGVTAAYRSGAQLPTLSTVDDDAIALRDVGMHESGDGPRTITYVVGTRQQVDKVRADQQESWFDEIPPTEYKFD